MIKSLIINIIFSANYKNYFSQSNKVNAITKTIVAIVTIK